jgi:glycosyltransferase involved in cell wall biosynthesis
MRILVLNHEFPPVGGGGGRAAEDICRGLAKRGHQIKVLTSHLKGLPYEEERDGYKIFRISSLRTQAFRASLPSMAAYILAGLWAGYRLIRNFKPDVIHVHFAVPAGALAWALSHLSGIPYVLTVHLGDVPGGVEEKTSGWFRWAYPFTRPIWRSASLIAAVSEFTRGLALKKYDAEIQVIPNGVDVNALRPEQLRLNDPPRVAFAGRFMPQKNPMQVVQTLNELRQLKWQCVMIGDGPLTPEVKRVVASLGLNDRFHFTGWIGGAEVLNWFDKSDILFMPSLSEGLPVVGIEALSKGLAIIASHVGGFVDLVENEKNGYLIRQKDAPGFLASLRELLSNPERLSSFRNASLERAVWFDINHIVEQYEDIFQRVARKEPLG